MTHPFSEINGDKLTPDQIAKRSKMIKEIIECLSTTDCCREYPNWEQLVYRASYEILCVKYKNLFGRDVE